MPGNLVVKHREVLDDGNTVVFITREETQPAWAPLGRFARVEWDLFIVHLHRESGLLFICTSRRLDVIYRDLALKLAGEDHDILPVPVINRVLRGIDGPEAFSVGIRNRIHTAAESYRIMLGPNAVRALTRSHGRMYHRGHGMFRGMRGEEPVTIGFSSSSKVWSNSYQHIPGLVSWFNDIAAKLVDERAVHTNSNWDFMPMSEHVDRLPDQLVIAIDFNADAYAHAPIIQVPGETATTEHSLLDCDMELVDPQPTNAIRFRIAVDDGPEWTFDFKLRPQVTITFVAGSTLPSVEWEETAVPLDEWLAFAPPTFYYPDFSALIGREQVVPDLAGVVFDRDRIEIVDWAAEGVDIRSEVRNPQKGKRSIHVYLAVRLRTENHAIVAYDDGSGEIADFVTIDETDAAVVFTLYHAKGSKGAQPGERVEDVYEVCGQAVKSTRWATDPVRLIDRLLSRLRKRPAEHLITGTIDELKRLRSTVRRKEVSYAIALVQPGISRASMSRDVIALPIAAADVYIVGGGMFEDLRIIGSA
jgi:hypothetical protein